MKKLTTISIFIPVIIVIVMAFSFNNNTEPAPMTTTVNVHVIGCPNNDCSHLQYCLTDGSVGFPGNCNFTIQLSEGTYYLCVKCSYPDSDIGGGKTIICSGGTMDVYMGIGILENCECNGKKK
jgi:hypothetical protein